MDFSTDKVYMIVENYFDQPAKYVLAERFESEDGDILDEIDLRQFEGKGVVVSLCRLLGPVEPSEEEEDELLMTVNDRHYAFCVDETLAHYPRIEGELTPGIYFNKDDAVHYELKTLEDITEFYLIPSQVGFRIHEYKIVCKKAGMDFVLIEDGAEEYLETIPLVDRTGAN